MNYCELVKILGTCAKESDAEVINGLPQKRRVAQRTTVVEHQRASGRQRRDEAVSPSTFNTRASQQKTEAY
jgi:hypothetical protein